MPRIFISLFILSFLFASSVHAQISNEFQIGERLMQQQKYEEALPVLQSVHEDQPQIYVYFERLVECLVELKRYENAQDQINENIQRNLNVALNHILLAKIYHIEGKTDRAFQLWNANLSNYSNQLQVYINTAQAMIDRKAYEEAIDVYRQGRTKFNNNRLFMMDIPNAYMKAGMYDEAISEWLTLIKSSPQQTSFIQRMLLRYNDPLLNDITILELEDVLMELSVNDPAYSTFYELQIWLLLENNLYRRAFAAAKEYESKTSNSNFSLFNVGRKLAENREFELSAEAFNYYIESSSGEIRWRSIEEKADVLMQWAKYINDYSLESSTSVRNKNTEAVDLLNSIISETTNYSRIEQVLLKRAELYLDHLYDLNEARRSVEQINRIPGMENTAESNYLEGRIHIIERSFTEARISLTRANKQAEIGDLAEKSRYFLALTDFFAGDFEFAEIQLKTLGRQNTSYYANDAIELRLWIQNGTAADTTGEQLSEFANAYYQFFTGERKQAADQFFKLIQSDRTSMQEESLILLSRIDEVEPAVYLSTIQSFIDNNPVLSQKERILWEKASVQYEIYQQLDNTEAPNGAVTVEELSNTLEEIILSYPNGFYAPFARERLGELPSVTS
jgi:hypothetical protein